MRPDTPERTATSDRSLSTLLEATAEAARVGGAVALEHFRSRLQVDRKPDGSPVTEADRAAERALRSWIQQRFPADGILGEELPERLGSSGRTWLIDPIDGTRTFVRGVPLWGTLVAIREGDRVLAGAACFPATGDLLAAAPDQGCWHNGSRCRVSTVDALDEAAVLATDPENFDDTQRPGWNRLCRVADLVRTWGDCYGYLLVATGRAEVMLDARLHSWDSACLLPIITEAGGSLTDWSGRVTAFGASAIATNDALAQPVRELLR